MKTKSFVVELLFVILVTSVVFLVTFHEMSSDGILPGNDPALHLDKAKTIILNGGVSYSELPWYPPLFHTFLAILLLLAGSVDVMIASLVLKVTVALINVFLMLSTYLLSKRLLSRGVAVASTMFMLLSVPVFENIFWGGYPSFLGIAYMVMIFYVMNKNFYRPMKAFLLFLVTFALVLTHQLAALVFLLVFVPSFLISTVKSKREFLLFLAAVLGAGLAILAWYADSIVRHADVLVYHVFFEMKLYVYSIPSVSISSLVRDFGIIFFLALAGLPLSLFMLRKKRMLRIYPSLIFWVAVPLFFSQSYLLGVYLPYDRFIYFLVTPLAILAGASVYYLAKLPVLISSRFRSKFEIKRIGAGSVTLIALVMLVILFSSQCFLFLQRLQDFPQFYETSGKAGYDTGQWVKQYTIQNASLVVSEKPGTWLHAISDHTTIEEEPLWNRNAVAEAVLYQFYDMDNTQVLTREFVAGGSISGQALYLSPYNIWKKTLSIRDEYVFVVYLNAQGKETVISLSETAKKTCWLTKSLGETQLVSEYSTSLFTVEKLVSLQKENSLVNIGWKLTAHKNLTEVQIKVFTYPEPLLNFSKAFVPGELDWQNPWEKPSRVDRSGWAVVDYTPSDLEDNVAGLLDEQNNVLAVYRFPHVPDWLNIGVLANHGIDALRVGYKLGDLSKDENQTISFSVLLHMFEHNQFEWYATDNLKQLLNQKRDLTLTTRDFPEYIREFNIKFIVVDSQRILFNAELSSILEKVYDNGKIVIYSIRQ